jgi:CIC family chloride channel protein
MKTLFISAMVKVRSWYLKSLLEQHRLILDAFILGVVGSLSVQFFLLLLHYGKIIFLKYIAGYTPIGLASEGGSPIQIIGPYGLWLIPVATTIGGLLAGFLIYSFAPESEGLGTNTAIKAFHWTHGFIRARVPLIKMIASVITMGSGGVGGREGPTTLFTAGLGSIYGAITRRSEKERRMLLLITASAGLSAIFRSPIGMALFATEVLYGDMEFEAEALLYTMISALVGYGINGIFWGWTPVFQIATPIYTPSFAEYFRFAFLGIIAGLVATLVPMVFYYIRDGFKALKIAPHFKPAIGGLIVGLIATQLPGVLEGGYGWIEYALNGHLSMITMGLLFIAMIVALPMSIASGGSGGVFTPTLFIGGMMGGFFALLLNQPATPFIIAGMIAVYGSSARVPIAAIIMVTEMTGAYNLLPLASFTVMIGYFLHINLASKLKYPSIYSAQVTSRSESPTHHGEQLESVLKLLTSGGLSIPQSIPHIDLRNLLLTGVPIDLPENHQMVIVTVQPGSPSLNKTVHELFPLDTKDDVEIIAGFHRDRLLLPHSEIKLNAGDRLLAIVSLAGKESLNNSISTQVD